MHVDAAAPCRLDPIQQQLGFAPIISAGELHMGQLDMDAAGLPNIDGFRNGFMDAVRFVADVGGLACAIPLQYRAERMQFIRFAKTGGSGKQSRRKPERTAEEISPQLFDLLRKRRRHREAAIANNLGRYNLPNLPVRLRVKWQGEVGMRVDVGETGRHDLTLRIDHALGAVSSVLFGGRNPPIPDCHIRRARRRARPVDD